MLAQRPRLRGSSLDFEFVREYIKINKVGPKQEGPKFHFFTKIEIKMIHFVFLFWYFTVSLPLESFGSRFIDV